MNQTGMNNMEVTLPLPFSSSEYFAVATAFTGNSTISSDGAVCTKTTSKMTLVNTNWTYPMYWLAFGY